MLDIDTDYDSLELGSYHGFPDANTTGLEKLRDVYNLIKAPYETDLYSNSLKTRVSHPSAIPSTTDLQKIEALLIVVDEALSDILKVPP